MKILEDLLMICCLLAFLFINVGCSCAKPEKIHGVGEMIKLPLPEKSSDVSLESVIAQRRSQRSYGSDPLTIKQVSQILWAAQGITGENERFRAAPSAGAMYPLEIYLLAGNVKDLKAGVYAYHVDSHSLKNVAYGDKRAEMFVAAANQEFIKSAPAIFLVTALFHRTAQRYGSRAERYCYMEAGHAGQNICLQAEALGLGTVPVGAIDEGKTRTIIGLKSSETPLYLFPVGPNP